MIIITDKKELNKSELKDVLKEENFKVGRYETKKYIIKIDENDLNTDDVEGKYSNLLNLFGRDLGFSINPPKKIESDKYVILKFSRNTYVFDNENKLWQLTQACMETIAQRKDFTKLFGSSLIKFKDEHIAMRISEIRSSLR